MTDWLADGPNGDLNEFGLDTLTPLDELKQDVVHRLGEAYGSNPDDRNRGVGVDTFLSGTPDLSALGRAIELDLRKDSRVDSVTVTVQQLSSDQTGGQYEVDIVINNSLTISTTIGGK